MSPQPGTDEPTPRPRLRRVWSVLGPDRRLFLAGSAGVLVEVVATSFAPLAVGWAIDAGVVGRDVGVVVRATALVAALIAVQACASRVWIDAIGNAAHQISARMRTLLVEKVYDLDLANLDRRPSGVVVSRLTSDVESLHQFVESGVPIVARAGLGLVLSLSVMAYTSPLLTVTVLGCLVPLVAMTAWYRRRAFVAQLGVRDGVAGLLGHVNESLTGAPVIQAFSLEAKRRAGFLVANQQHYDAKMTAASISVRYQPAVEVVQPATMAVVLAVGASLVVSGRLTVGGVVAFMLYLGRVFDPVQQLAELAHLLQAASASLAKIFAFLDEAPQVVEEQGAVDLPRGPGEVALEVVHFRYGAGAPEVLRDVTLRIAPGERVALVGRSGSGKSTVAKLLTRLYDPTAGRVLIDGQDLRRLNKQSVRRQVNLVPQEGFLFDGTIAENIAMGRPGAGRDDAVAASSALGVLARFEALPEGIDTVITSRGSSLSSGQRQLVALARAFLADPPVLVLDEATSNLDPATDLLVERAMRVVLRERTSIVIAHKVSSALRADRVVMLDNGCIVDQGRPSDLLRDGGPFAEWAAAGPTIRA